MRPHGRLFRLTRSLLLGLVLIAASCQQGTGPRDLQEPPIIDVKPISNKLVEGMPITFAMVRTSGSACPALVLYEMGGDMTPGKDYVPPAGLVALPDGAVELRWDVLTIDDDEPEWTETLRVNLRRAPQAGREAAAAPRPMRRPRTVDWELRRFPEGLRAALEGLPFGGSYDLDDLLTCSVVDERLQVQMRAPERLTRSGPYWEAGLPYLISIRGSDRVWIVSKASGWAWGSADAATKLVCFDPQERWELAITAVAANDAGLMFSGHSIEATGTPTFCVALIQTGWELILSHRLASDSQPRSELAANLTALRWRADASAYQSIGQVMGKLGMGRGAILTAKP